MAKCLVTGHKGYIGSKVFKKLEELGHEVMGIDLQEEVPKDILFYLKEYDGEHTLKGGFHPHFSNFKPEYVFHLACIPRVAYSVEEPVKTMENNVLISSYVLNFARKVGAKRVIYSGSSSVVGNGNGPTSPYGLQKLISEMECKVYSDLYGLDTVSLRYFNVYSPCQRADNPYATAVANWMRAIRCNTNPFITGDGTQRRDMAYVDDVVEANIFAMNYEESFGGKHFDIGTGTNISLNQIKEIVQTYHPDVVFDYVAPRKGDVYTSLANIQPLMNLGWAPTVSLKEGLARCFQKGSDGNI
jgi:nucleoside-diphosphate-sugar epimerase